MCFDQMLQMVTTNFHMVNISKNDLALLKVENKEVTCKTTISATFCHNFLHQNILLAWFLIM